MGRLLVIVVITAAANSGLAQTQRPCGVQRWSVKTLTDIAHRLHRTPGSTKDYLSWLEDVDVLNVERKKYTFDDPLVRLYVRLYTGAEPPTDDRIAAETRQFAAARLAMPVPPAAAPTIAPPKPETQAMVPTEATMRDTGIIEID